MEKAGGTFEQNNKVAKKKKKNEKERKKDQSFKKGDSQYHTTCNTSKDTEESEDLSSNTHSDIGQETFWVYFLTCQQI